MFLILKGQLYSFYLCVNGFIKLDNYKEQIPKTLETLFVIKVHTIEYIYQNVNDVSRCCNFSKDYTSTKYPYGIN